MPARGVFRGVSSVLFDDPDYQKLPSHARLLLVTLRLCHDAGLAVIFQYSTDTLMRQTGLDATDLDSAVRTLERRRWIVRERHLVWVRNGLRYDPLVRLADPKHKAAILRWITMLPRLKIVQTSCDYYKIQSPSPRVPEGPGGDPSLRNRNRSSEKGEVREVIRTRGVGAPTAPDVARATRSDSIPTKPPKGRYDQIRLDLAQQHPDWLPEHLDRRALHQLHQETRHA